ncbi:hypothetical protein, partial [Micromonospora tulbaghiae]|uniref:hypothetical protein n=1 Tax=Micromonospora tulbaghiae TaxID=479978 RepID=UPI0036BE2069
GSAAGFCSMVLSVVIWRLSLDRSISRYLYSPQVASGSAEVVRWIRTLYEARVWCSDAIGLAAWNEADGTSPRSGERRGKCQRFGDPHSYTDSLS